LPPSRPERIDTFESTVEEEPIALDFGQGREEALPSLRAEALAPVLDEPFNARGDCTKV